jgi:hypothetical protein
MLFLCRREERSDVAIQKVWIAASAALRPSRNDSRVAAFSQ